MAYTIVGETRVLKATDFGLPESEKQIPAPKGWIWQLGERDLGRKNKVITRFTRLIPGSANLNYLDVEEVIADIPPIIRLRHSSFPIVTEADYEDAKVKVTQKHIDMVNQLSCGMRSLFATNFHTWFKPSKHGGWKEILDFATRSSLHSTEGHAWKIGNHLYWTISGYYHWAGESFCWDLEKRDFAKPKNELNFQTLLGGLWRNREVPTFEEVTMKGGSTEMVEYQLKAQDSIDAFNETLQRFAQLASELPNASELVSINFSKTEKLSKLLKKLDLDFNIVRDEVCQTNKDYSK